MNQWWIIYNLIGHYDSEYTVKYVSDILKEDIYVLKFISKSVSVQVGSGKRYELGNEQYIIVTEPDTPLNDADHVGSFNLYGSGIYGTEKASSAYVNR